MEIGEAVRKMCHQRGLSVRALAEQLHVDECTVWRYLSGRVRMPDETLIQLAEMLNAPWVLLAHPVVRRWQAWGGDGGHAA